MLPKESPPFTTVQRYFCRQVVERIIAWLMIASVKKHSHRLAKA
jgi:hypothetical protein